MASGGLVKLKVFLNVGPPKDFLTTFYGLYFSSDVTHVTNFHLGLWGQLPYISMHMQPFTAYTYIKHTFVDYIYPQRVHDFMSLQSFQSAQSSRNRFSSYRSVIKQPSNEISIINWKIIASSWILTRVCSMTRERETVWLSHSDSVLYFQL